jgi:5-formaminoimidazole-4-carboxamide-1-beta-D-ribofuranosyl 5'-monophosphate synthetase
MICLCFQGGGGGGPPPPGVEIPNGAFIGKITNDAREEEMEENMEQGRKLTNWSTDKKNRQMSKYSI